MVGLRKGNARNLDYFLLLCLVYLQQTELKRRPQHADEQYLGATSDEDHARDVLERLTQTIAAKSRQKNYSAPVTQGTAQRLNTKLYHKRNLSARRSFSCHYPSDS